MSRTGTAKKEFHHETLFSTLIAKGGIHIAELKTRQVVEGKKNRSSTANKEKSKINPTARAAAISKATDAITRQREEEHQDAARPAEQVEAAEQYAAYEAGRAVRGAAYTLRTRDRADKEAPVSSSAPSVPQEAARAKAAAEAAKAARQPQFPVVEFPDFDPYANLPSIPYSPPAPPSAPSANATLLHERTEAGIKTPTPKAPMLPAASRTPQEAARLHAIAEAKRVLQTKQPTPALYPSVHPSIHPSEAHDPLPAPIEPPALFHEKPTQEIKTPPPKAAAKPSDTTPPGQQAGRQALIQKVKAEKAKRTAAEAASSTAPPITPITDAPHTPEQGARPIVHQQAEPLTNAAATERTTLKTRRRSEPAMKLKDGSRAAAIKTKGSTAAPQLAAAPGAIKTPTAVNAAAQAEAKRNILRIRRQGKELAIKQLTTPDKRIGKRLILAAGKFAKAAGKAVKDLFSALAAYCGGTVLIIVLCAVILVGALISSPMGILFSDEVDGDDGVSLTAAIGQITSEYSAQLRSMRSGYDSFSIVGHAPKWKDVIAVYACQTAGCDDGTEVLTLDAEHIQIMKDVFWDMTEITSTTSTIFHEDTDPEDEIDDSWTESVITITVTAKTAEDMESAYRFTKYQSESMEALLLELDEWDLFAIDLDISDATALSVWENLPDDLSPERRLVVQYALSLCGKVTYFWGGKYLVLGTDPRWGVSTQVWAAGSPTTGTYRPYGLDCSGFVDWAFYNASEGTYIIGRGGGVIAQHNNCRSISWSEAIPGDLVFYPGDSHIGIVVGWTSGGSILICHCASGSQNGVYVTGKVGFTSIGRPYYYSD